MKKTLLALIIISAAAYSQDQLPPGYHTHDGFFLSMSLGPGFGAIKNEATNFSFNTVEYNGFGGHFEFRIGGAISSNLILSFDIISRSISEPETTVDGIDIGAAANISISDVIAGAGLTYYFMPSNIFISGTLGMGYFNVREGLGLHSGSTRPGIGIQFKMGKEWWVSTDWALGVAGGIGYINADDKGIPLSNYHGEFSTTKLFVVFNATYN